MTKILISNIQDRRTEERQIHGLSRGSTFKADVKSAIVSASRFWNLKQNQIKVELVND